MIAEDGESQARSGCNSAMKGSANTATEECDMPGHDGGVKDRKMAQEAVPFERKLSS